MDKLRLTRDELREIFAEEERDAERKEIERRKGEASRRAVNEARAEFWKAKAESERRKGTSTSPSPKTGKGIILAIFCVLPIMINFLIFLSICRFLT